MPNLDPYITLSPANLGTPKDQPTCKTCDGNGFVGHARQMGKRGPHLCPACTGKQPEMIMGVDSAFPQEPSPSNPTSEREKIGEILGTHFLTWRDFDGALDALELLLQEARKDEIYRSIAGEGWTQAEVDLAGRAGLLTEQQIDRLKELESHSG